MSDIVFSRAEIEPLVSKIKKYFLDELDQDIGAFEAEFLIDFFAKQLGPKLYNQGLQDALSLFTVKAEELAYQVQEFEKPAV